jgi:alkylation response protein AidB-like acyl-CoA dehydrogenase
MSSPASTGVDTATNVLKPDFGTRRKYSLFSDEHEQLRDSIHAFVVRELAPHAEEWEETTFPDWVFERMGELGFLGLDKPEEYGGQGGDYFTSLVLAEEIVHARSGGLAMGVAVHTDMAMPPILAFGSEEQKRRRSPARRSSASASPSPTPAPMSPASRRARCATAMTG